MRKTTRQRKVRRDRRKDKISGYNRLPKKPGVVGHGSAITTGIALGSRNSREEGSDMEKIQDDPIATLGEIVASIGGDRINE